MTKGKWRVSNDGKRVIRGGMLHPATICTLSSGQEQNAQAIAAVPDLIEALEAFLTDAKADKLPSAKSPIRLETILKARQDLANAGVEVEG